MTAVRHVQARRLPGSPIVVPEMDARMGRNITGPSLVRVPEWCARPLARYYLYFASHWGSYIRLALADGLQGPWRTYEPGVFDLAQSRFVDHIASPDVIIDHERREFRMYYHGAIDSLQNQRTRVAVSQDGLTFTEQPDVILDWYARIFRWDGWWYALTMPGTVWRSRDGLTGFERGPVLFGPQMRHSAVRVVGTDLQVFYTNVGDCPETILLAVIDLTGDWRTWTATRPEPVLAPERDYEGGALPARPSSRGPVTEPVCELRDPAIYEEGARTFMLYAVAGESGIALAEIEERMDRRDTGYEDK